MVQWKDIQGYHIWEVDTGGDCAGINVEAIVKLTLTHHDESMPALILFIDSGDPEYSPEMPATLFTESEILQRYTA